MKKILSLILVCAMLVCSVALFASCDTEKIIVHTNAFFAPFEYYEGTEIKGVDVEIMNLVGKKLGKKIGTQTDTTGWIYTDGEINATEDNDYGYNGVLYGTGTELKNYDNAQLAADAITANAIDVVIIDELPAQYIVSKNSGFKCLPLYYSGETDAEDAPVEEQYAICVTKGNTELLEAINEVLEELMVVGENGKTKIEEMVMAHMGME